MKIEVLFNALKGQAKPTVFTVDVNKNAMSDGTVCVDFDGSDCAFWVSPKTAREMAFALHCAANCAEERYGATFLGKTRDGFSTAIVGKAK